MVADYMSRLDNDDTCPVARLTITSSSSSSPPVLLSQLRSHHLLQLQQLGLTVQRQHPLTSVTVDTRAERRQRVDAENSTNFASESSPVRVRFYGVV